MARSRWQDLLQDHLFWCMDISSVKSVPVFTPLFGFSAISAPKINVELETFNDGTYNYPRHVVKRATVGEMTFTRAASLYDSDFYDWIYFAINGVTPTQAAGVNLFQAANMTPRRDLLLFQFARVNLAASSNQSVNAILLAEVSAAILLAGGSITAGLAVGATAAGTALAGSPIPAGPFTFASWLPARAWVLRGCLPVSYTSASDFNASSGQVSLMSLSVAPEYCEEYSLGI